MGTQARRRHNIPVTLQLDNDEANALVRLMTLLGAENIGEVVAQAVMFQDACLSAQTEGHRILCRMENGEEIELSFDLAQARPSDLH